MQSYDDIYYETNGQAGDRPALAWYVRVAQRYLDLASTCDFGCGTGWLMKRLGGHGQAAGVETSPWARGSALARNPNCHVVPSLDDFPDRHFSAMFAVHVVEHLSDDQLEAVFAGFRRVLAPGGGLFLVTPDAGGVAHSLMGPTWRAFEDPTHTNLKPGRAWLDLLAAQGFDLVAAGTDGLWDWPYHSAAQRWITGPAMVAAQLVTGRLLSAVGQGESLVAVATMRPHE